MLIAQRLYLHRAQGPTRRRQPRSRRCRVIGGSPTSGPQPITVPRSAAAVLSRRDSGNSPANERAQSRRSLHEDQVKSPRVCGGRLDVALFLPFADNKGRQCSAAVGNGETFSNGSFC